MTVAHSLEIQFDSDSQGTRNSLVEFVRTRSREFGLWIGLSESSHEAHSCVFHPDPWTVLNPVQQFESATSVDEQQARALDSEIEAIVSLATEENIEDGMDSQTEVRLGAFIALRSIGGVERLSGRLTSGCINAGATADIVRVLGCIDHTESHDERLWIAVRMLRSGQPPIRDAGAVALEELGDKRAVHALQEAAKVESIPDLRADIGLALRELKRSIDGVHSSKA